MSETKTQSLKVKPAELEKLIIELHKEGHMPAKIGLILRDKHGVPKAKMAGKKITKILVENKQEVPAEHTFVKKKIDVLGKHIAQHKHDYTAKRSLNKKQWTLHRLTK